MEIKKIAVLTSGGDAPGMNAAIRAVVRTGISRGVEVYGASHGYNGLVKDELKLMQSVDVANIIQRGGTILKSSRSADFKTQEGRRKAYDNLKQRGIDGLICIGGNGTQSGAHVFSQEFDIPVMGVASTIDNDLYGTDYTLGFDTAVNTALDAIDRIRDTANSHDRVFFVEVMGRDAGFIALQVGLASGAEAILVPEDKGNDHKVLESIFGDPNRREKSFSIVIVAEGDEEGGAFKTAARIKEKFPHIDPRVSVLGHLQRGGKPTAFDRVLASTLGNLAVESLLNGENGKLAGWKDGKPTLINMHDAVSKTKQLNSALLRLNEILNT